MVCLTFGFTPDVSQHLTTHPSLAHNTLLTLTTNHAHGHTCTHLMMMIMKRKNIMPWCHFMLGVRSHLL